MFDNRRLKFTNPDDKINIHNRAPIEESIRLSMEYEQKILQKIIDKFQCVDNIINISWFEVEDFISNYLVIKMSINGKEFSTKIHKTMKFDDLINEIINWVACTIVKPSFDDVYMHLLQLKPKDNSR